jgi:hypothetical protein
MLKQLIALYSLFTLCLVGCAPVPSAPARLRITNTSAFTIKQVTIIFPNERISFGPVVAGASSDYQAVLHGVYDSAAYELLVNRQTIVQPVIDWVAAQPLQGDQFTYMLTIDLHQTEGSQIRGEVRQE